MYKVEVYHYREAIVKGDLEDESVLIQSELFKTRKSAKEWIENKVRGKSGVTKSYHKGDQASYVWHHTGHIWRHENSGEICHECYTYKLEKAKVI